MQPGITVCDTMLSQVHWAPTGFNPEPEDSDDVLLSGRVVKTLDLTSTWRELKPWPPRCRVQPWACC